MRKFLFFYLLIHFVLIRLNAQEAIVLDFETAETSTTFSYFDSGDWPHSMTSVAENPDKSGINTSDSVMYFGRGVGGQTWAGAYGNPKPTRKFDFTTHNRLVAKVWAAKSGNIQLKLEGGPNGGDDNWERVLQIPATGEWVRMEWDVTLPGQAGTMVPAFGKVYENLVIFLNFGEVTTEQVIVYFDDIGTDEGEAAQPVPVTFLLNASGFSGSISSVNVVGSFNEWSATATPMTEVGSGSNLYIGTADVNPGLIEYKFVINGSTWEEGFSPLDECVVNNGGFLNRTASISEATELSPACWNKCYNCGEDVNITFNVSFPASNPPSDEGAFIAGGAKFESPGGKYRLADIDGDGIYNMVINRGQGFNSHFTVTTGPCEDYSCKENLEGQSCGDASNYNDRKIEAVTQDTIINICFGDCSGQACILSNKVMQDAGFTLTPNPANQEIYLNFTQALTQNGQLSIIDAMGNVVNRYAYKMGDEVIRLDISHLPAGIYMVTYLKNNQIGTHKFIKNN